MKTFLQNIYASVYGGYYETDPENPGFMATSLIAMGQLLQLIFFDCISFRVFHFSYIDALLDKNIHIVFFVTVWILDAYIFRKSQTENICQNFFKKTDKEKMKWRLIAATYIIGPAILSLILVWVW